MFNVSKIIWSPLKIFLAFVHAWYFKLSFFNYLITKLIFETCFLVNIEMKIHWFNCYFSTFPWLATVEIIHFLLPIEEKNPLVLRPLHFFVPNFFCIILLDVILVYFNISWWSYKLSESQIKIKENFVFQNDSFYVYEWALKLCHNKTFRHLFNPSNNYFLFFWTSWNSWQINVFLCLH
jgi:hypothetical protein